MLKECISGSRPDLFEKGTPSKAGPTIYNKDRLHSFAKKLNGKPTDDVEKLSQAAAFLAQQAEQDQEEIKRLRAAVVRLSASVSLQKVEDRGVQHPVASRRWTEPIAVLVFACNRAAAVSNLIKRLISLRPSKEQFPITVSQDCNDKAVQRAVAEFGEEVQYVKHRSAQEDHVVVPANQKRFATYYYIARHYKLALEHVFDILGHNSVILLEDDLDISIDFFEYFLATRYLLDRDPTLMCVSAWNDNGKAENIDREANTLLYRSDFFPGLGWMMTSRLWRELQPKWPNGFWDDWLREPENRKMDMIVLTMCKTLGPPVHSSGDQPDWYDTFWEERSQQPEYNITFNRNVYQNSQLMSIDVAVEFSKSNRNAGQSVRTKQLTLVVAVVRDLDRKGFFVSPDDV
ncbi:GNT-I family protein [Teladorsagia circumcincta]|uniref:Alpha-1,3-mannosyl-glycoprotein 2-beta-N-acetylglucosaminyltransferase n=1 Tax=Teladorsagia circumcincta TaxID=45464 RepID=A0A2G9UHG0_TELCI|nr:GNT-I family protein [Teladorsagia circumcincta]